VLDVANALMAEAPRQYRKHLLSTRGDGAAEARHGRRPAVAGRVHLRAGAERSARNVALRRQAVLFRTASHSDLLEIELTRRKIPFVKYGGLRFLEAAHVKDLLAVLRWADNPRNGSPAFRVLQLLPGMGPVNARKVAGFLRRAGQVVRRAARARAARGREARVEQAARPADRPRDAAAPWAGQLRLVRDWYKPHFERQYEHFHTRVGDLDQLELLWPAARRASASSPS
jgi:DNA helicase II / ATP-dependent DNA helicase PcrA